MTDGQNVFVLVYKDFGFYVYVHMCWECDLPMICSCAFIGQPLELPDLVTSLAMTSGWDGGLQDRQQIIRLLSSRCSTAATL